MPLNEPQWWYRDRLSWQALGLGPLSWLYGQAAALRFSFSTPYQSRLPVICVGNFTAGGTGKTPLSLAVAGLIRDLGREPVFLSRGYGGDLPGPIYVDPTRHTAKEVGDEPLLLAQSAPTVIARQRPAGAKLIEANANTRTVIVMDDGLQNPSIVKNLVIAVVDGKRGLGNGWPMPSGPLRATLKFQTRLTSAVVLNGAERPAAEVASLRPLIGAFPGPILNAHAEPKGPARNLAGAKLIAFAGIANPERFFAMLEHLGAKVAERVAFPDHHTFTLEDAESLLAKAAVAGAGLITTEKDLARLCGSTENALSRLHAASSTLPIRLAFNGDDAAELLKLIGRAIQRRPV